MKITPIKLSLSNAYLVQGDKPVLIDTGAPKEEAKIVATLKRAGVTLNDLSLIAHTHVHGDHVGSTVALTANQSVPTAYHQADQYLADQGHNGMLTGTTWRGTLFALLFNESKFDSPTPDFYLTDGQRLDEYGIAGQICHTPAHTAGSVSIILDNGSAIIGDLLMGGYMGGNFLSSQPNLHYFAEEIDQVLPSLRRVLAHPVDTLYVGHGGPLSAEAVRAKFDLT